MNAVRWIALVLVGCGLNACAQYQPVPAQGAAVAKPPGGSNGRTLFLKNCAHCHGANAHGDEGPDLHALGLNDDWIANRIRQGKAGQMTAFAGKLQPAEIAALVAYVQSLK